MYLRGNTSNFASVLKGKLKKKCHVCIHLKTEHGDYGPVEDLQLVINHVLAHWFQEKLKK